MLFQNSAKNENPDSPRDEPPTGQKIESDLATRLASNSEEAVNELFDVYYGWLVRFFRKRGVPYADAEDLASTTLTQVIDKIHLYAPREGIPFSGWVFKIGRNKLFSARRSEKRPPTTDLESHSYQLSSNTLEEFLSDGLSLDEISQAVQEAISLLPARHQRVIRLRYFEGNETSADLAEALGVGINTARTRLSRASEKLRLLLEQDPRLQRIIRRAEKRKGC